MRSIYFKLCLSKSLLLPTGSLLPRDLSVVLPFQMEPERRIEATKPRRLAYAARTEQVCALGRAVCLRTMGTLGTGGGACVSVPLGGRSSSLSRCGFARNAAGIKGHAIACAAYGLWSTSATFGLTVLSTLPWNTSSASSVFS